MNVVVLGSLVFDIAVRVDRMPQDHETVLASEAVTSAGGKGLCQAVAARRLGATVDVVGRVGDDVFGRFLLDVIDGEGIGRTGVRTDAAGTHLGIPMVTPDGANRIIGVPRASANVSPADVDAVGSILAECDLLLLQGETPLPACVRALELKRDGALVVWNPAPATLTLDQMLDGPQGRAVGWLTPNEAEARSLTGVDVTEAESAVAAARVIRGRFPHVGVVVTIGERGSVAIDPVDRVVVTPAMSMPVVDTTAAGDVFSAAFGLTLIRTGSLDLALRFATAAGGLATTRMGAVRSIPTLVAVEDRLAQLES